MSAYPFADQSRRYDGRYPSSGYSGGPNKGVLHTTEGASLPGYDNGAKAPHFTLLPDTKTRTVKIYQHFDTARPSRALANKSGGVQTNNDGVVQIELVGTCATGGPGMFWPGAPTWALDGVARLMRWIEQDRGIPREAARTWLPYPQSYGATAARMSPAEWDSFAGWCGHQHVPENAHGDPGQLDMAYLLGTTIEEKINMKALVYGSHDGKIWVGDGITRRHITSWPLVEQMQALTKRLGGDPTINELLVPDVLGEVQAARSDVESARDALLAVAGGDVDEQAIADALLPTLAAVVGENAGLTREDVEIALRRVLGSLDNQ